MQPSLRFKKNADTPPSINANMESHVTDFGQCLDLSWLQLSRWLDGIVSCALRKVGGKSALPGACVPVPGGCVKHRAHH